jgi:hypothetical protein
MALTAFRALIRWREKLVLNALTPGFFSLLS